MVFRVLHVSASFPRRPDDAVAPFLLDLVAGQRAAGWDAAVVAVHDAGLPLRHEVAGVPVRRVRYGPARAEVLAYRGGGHGRLRSPAHALLLPGLAAALAAAVASEVRRWRPDVVHAHFLLPGGLAAALLRRSGRPRVVVTLHGTDVALAAGRARPLARTVAGRADAVLAVSAPLARQAEDILGLSTGAVGVARLPLPAGLVPAPLPAGPLRLLAAGRASTEKGFDVLVAALALPEASAWSATLVTEGPERPALEKQAASLGLGDRLRFEPLVPRAALHDMVRAHSAVVVPSRSEGLGMMALEALALGRPVVASSVGGLPEVVEDGVDGVLVPADDPLALARALAGLRLVAPTGAAAGRHRAEAVVAAHAAAYGTTVPHPVETDR
ncbi:MAG: glycosyltransferase [Acidimicrobiia bacterium]